MKKTLSLFACLVTFLPLSVQSAGYTDPQTIGELTITSGGTMFIRSSGADWTNVDSCEKSSQVIYPSATGDVITDPRAQLGATIIAAKLKNATVSLKVSGCIQAGLYTYPKLTGIRIEN